MTQRELKEKLYDLVAKYFALLDERGNIIWGKTKPVNPGIPMVSLDLSQVQRPYSPARRYVDGIVHDSYPSSTILRVDLFTKGAATTNEPNVTSRNENTAVSDLSDFANFLNSVYVDHWCGRNGISLKARTVQDLTALVNETSWQYRALLEVDVGFMQVSVEQELADDFTGYFTEVDGPEDTSARGTKQLKSTEIKNKKEAPRYG